MENGSLLLTINETTLSIDFITLPPSFKYLSVVPKIFSSTLSQIIDESSLILLAIKPRVNSEPHFLIICPLAIKCITITIHKSSSFFLSVKPFTFIVVLTYMDIFPIPVLVTHIKLSFVVLTIAKSIFPMTTHQILSKVSSVWVSVGIFHCSLTFFHAVFELSFEMIAVCVFNESFALDFVIYKLTLVHSPIRICYFSLALTFILDPVTFILVTICVNKGSISMFIIIAPASFVFLSSRKILEKSLTFPHSIDKISLIIVSIGNIILSITIFDMILKRSFINGSRGKEIKSFSMEEIINEISKINVAIAAVKNALALFN